MNTAAGIEGLSGWMPGQPDLAGAAARARRLQELSSRDLLDRLGHALARP